MNMKPYVKIKNRRIGPGYPCYVVAEMSANHNHSYDEAVKIIEEYDSDYIFGILSLQN